MSSTVALTAVLPLAGILVGAGLQYFFGRSLELRKHIQSQKAQAYADYFEAFSQIAAVGRTKDALSALTDSKTRICIYGSNSVLEKLAAFERAGPSTASPESHKQVVMLLDAMRKDLGSSTKPAKAADIGVVVFGSDWKS